jgi:hemolysin III
MGCRKDDAQLGHVVSIATAANVPGPPDGMLARRSVLARTAARDEVHSAFRTGYPLQVMDGQQSLEEVIPRLRGLLHAYAFYVAAVAAAVLVILAPPGRPRVAAAIYGAALCALFAASGLYHRWRWSPRWKPLLRRLDHSTIYLFIAATSTPIALLVLEGTLRVVVLSSVWAGAVLGIAFALAWIDAPRLLVCGTYLAVGWAGVVAVPQLLDEVGVTPFALFLAGGVLYSAGAYIYAARRPDPWPRTFGFHELFHLLVIAAAVTHFIALAGWVLPHSGA